MKVSSRVDYALSCVLRVADEYERTEKPLSVAVIAKLEQIETDYAEQLLIRIKRAGIVKSVRGPCGGYMLTRAPSDITAFEVVSAIDRYPVEVICFRKKGRRNRCVHWEDCRIRNFWLNMNETVEKYLKQYNLRDLLIMRRSEKNWL